MLKQGRIFTSIHTPFLYGTCTIMYIHVCISPIINQLSALLQGFIQRGGPGISPPQKIYTCMKPCLVERLVCELIDRGRNTYPLTLSFTCRVPTLYIVHVNAIYYVHVHVYIPIHVHIHPHVVRTCTCYCIAP